MSLNLKVSVDESIYFQEQMSFIFGLKEKIGSLATALKLFGVSLTLNFFESKNNKLILYE